MWPFLLSQLPQNNGQLVHIFNENRLKWRFNVRICQSVWIIFKFHLRICNYCAENIRSMQWPFGIWINLHNEICLCHDILTNTRLKTHSTNTIHNKQSTNANKTYFKTKRQYLIGLEPQIFTELPFIQHKIDYRQQARAMHCVCTLLESSRN